MHFARSAGILLHITSLPGDFGIGELGASARGFVDFLHASGQQLWQMLPLSPTLEGESPYSSYSAFAGNPLMISLGSLVEDGLLSQLQYDQLSQSYPPTAQDHCDFPVARACKAQALSMAFDAFLTQSACHQFDEFEAFCTRQKWWLDDFALFASLMKYFDTNDWSQWDVELVHRDRVALGRWKDKLARQVEFEQFVQFLFYRQWQDLRDYARLKQVKLFGDMPIFVAHGSADVWANQSLFCLKGNGQPQFVAGVPPDYFSKTGQLWGNPLYRWDAIAAAGYQWWLRRFQASFEWFDLLRIDHFRGFEAYWEIPGSAMTAIHGRWAPGPGAGPFDAARRVLGDLPIVAEDLGLITDEVHALRESLGFPGMRVLQFGFDHERDAYHRPDDFPEDSFAYTGTHDNSTILGWYQEHEKKKGGLNLLSPYLAAEPQDLPIHWQLLSMVYRSKACVAIAPMQDILGLDDRARFNRPGIAAGNWGWRVAADQLTTEISSNLKELALQFQRTGSR